ncbi:MAG: ScpA family protein [Chloroflexota bacterium]
MFIDELNYTFHIPAFEGPLDLLLRLIEREELDITTIALAQVTDQYLVHVRNLNAPDPAALSSFLVLAARLLVIKSRALLPRPSSAQSSDEAVDDAENLIQQLREYQRYKQVATLLQTWQAYGYRSYTRQDTLPLLEPRTTDKLDVTVSELLAAIQRRLQLTLPLEPPAVPLPTPKTITVPEMASRIQDRLIQQEWICFEDVLSLQTYRTEIIVALWSLLELLKRRAVVVEQADLFGLIRIGRGPHLATVHHQGLTEA